MNTSERLAIALAIATPLLVACVATHQALTRAQAAHSALMQHCAESLPTLRAVAASTPECADCERLPQAVGLVETICKELSANGP